MANEIPPSDDVDSPLPFQRKPLLRSLPTPTHTPLLKKSNIVQLIVEFISFGNNNS